MTNRGWSIPDVYATKSCDLDICPECSGPKTKHGLMCIACRRRIGRSRRDVASRFWEKVDRRGPDECWLWTAVVDQFGYGRFNYHGRSVKAGRVALELDGRPCGPGQGACHHCDNPPCLNPRHLYPGTQKENLRDMVARGRDRYHRTKEAA